jgi:hypothetical protein
VELLTLAGGRVDTAVVHPGTDHLDPPSAGRKNPRLGMPVAPYQSMPTLVGELLVSGQVGIDLGLQRDRQHPPGTLAEQLVQVGGQLGPCLLVNHYTQHAAFLPRRRWRAGVLPTGQGERYAALSCEGSSTGFDHSSISWRSWHWGVLPETALK